MAIGPFSIGTDDGRLKRPEKTPTPGDLTGRSGEQSDVLDQAAEAMRGQMQQILAEIGVLQRPIEPTAEMQRTGFRERNRQLRLSRQLGIVLGRGETVESKLRQRLLQQRRDEFLELSREFRQLTAPTALETRMMQVLGEFMANKQLEDIKKKSVLAAAEAINRGFREAGKPELSPDVVERAVQTMDLKVLDTDPQLEAQAQFIEGAKLGPGIGEAGAAAVPGTLSESFRLGARLGAEEETREEQEALEKELRTAARTEEGRVKRLANGMTVNTALSRLQDEENRIALLNGLADVQTQILGINEDTFEPIRQSFTVFKGNRDQAHKIRLEAARNLGILDELQELMPLFFSPSVDIMRLRPLREVEGQIPPASGTEQPPTGSTNPDTKSDIDRVREERKRRGASQ